MSGPAVLDAVLRGSHTALIEARAVTGHPTGANPPGTALDIIDGDVELDATAAVHGTLRLTVSGTAGGGGARTHWPGAGTDSLLSPWGGEVFVRRGLRTPSGTWWSPLGYYRIDTVEQTRRRGQIALTGSDRMATVRDSTLIAPRQYGPQVTLAEVFADLIGELIPDALIRFDSGTGAAPLGRAIVCEDDRYATLAQLAAAHGQIPWWDGEGVLRVRDIPDAPEPVWTVDAGPGGVLVETRRRLTRAGAAGAVVARGETAGTSEPVQAVAYDTDPASPARWGGPMGMVPFVFESAAILTVDQAARAAAAMLRRGRGRPSAIDFGSIVHPGLRPWDRVRVTGANGGFEVHQLERLTVPLTIDAAMSASTRDQTALTTAPEVLA
ncbi:DUF5047 domain-containing protein [Glycomyces sp. NPDC048151]|uniref:DUF5047 domain-containing protein n=1 Tax=Glycomyces sp. NPDC048151 TaxID=3364002 RepID=UPI00371F3B16